MSKAAVSLLVFGLYLLGLGALLVVAPNLILSVFGLEPTTEVWSRIVGMLLIFLGCYDVASARVELTPFFRWSVPLRASVILFFGAFVALDLATPILLIFGLVDLAGAVWTAYALRGDSRTDGTAVMPR